MKSNGGVTSAEGSARTPITTVLSGPAAGALGAAAVTGAAGFDRVVTLDGGGTSTDVAVIRGGVPALTTDGTVGRFPAKVPMIDIVTVGAGGGSIAWVSPEGALKVGPRSAGADPGPLCYGRGGTEPTLTDAALVLGRIPPHLLGGEIPLDAAAARGGHRGAGRRASASRPRRAPRASLEIWAWNQANAIRQVTVRRGIDVRDLALCAFGGSGPLQAGRLLDVLDLPAAVVPPDPGNLCALGLLTVDVRHRRRAHVRGRPRRPRPRRRWPPCTASWRTEAAAALAAEGFDPAEQRFLRSADLRYDGQAFEVRVDVPAGAGRRGAGGRRARPVPRRARAPLRLLLPRPARSHGVEWVNVRAHRRRAAGAPARGRRPGGHRRGRPRPGRRPVWFGGAWHDTPRSWRRPTWARATRSPAPP